MGKVKVFCFEGEYIAARTQDEAIEYMSNMTGEEYFYEDCPELTDKEMEDFNFFVDDIGTISHSFKKQLEILIETEQDFPCYFASENI